MKSTKNLLITGIVLTITSFASIQVTAMERRENPYLSQEDKNELKEAIRYTEGAYLDPKHNSLESIKETQAQLKACKQILYGNRPYTIQEIHAAIYE